MQEFHDDGVLREADKKFEVENVESRDGFSYRVYFPSEEAAVQAIIDFWNSRVGSESAVRGIKSGMLNPRNPKHTITFGDRTRLGALAESDQQKHPGMTYTVWFNGNEGAITRQGAAALRYLGFIE
jgi:hypothetical protein